MPINSRPCVIYTLGSSDPGRFGLGMRHDVAHDSGAILVLQV